IGLEYLGLMSIGVATVIVVLGYSANRFSGTRFFNSYLPFTTVIIGGIILGVILLGLWQRLRRWLRKRSSLLPPAVVLGLALVISGLAPPELFSRAFLYYRVLVGGKEEANRVALTHQVYAAYRRLNTVQMTKMIRLSEPYKAAIEEAGAFYGIDGNLLKGLAATESSFLPRASIDGGQGLFQVTKVPATVTMAVNRLFPVKHRVVTDARYNAYLGAATLRHYLTEMKEDLFLGLLAYNIGPANGGLRFIMDQYGATDFITIQPYLMQLPRDYPIRVLSYSLAFRIERQEGQLLAYEEGKNALRIQAIGIPGLR
ncbi:MAG: transglycosylase SLT domain-containing protein, partial [Proteobacteria bacterium]|nr:transglycosylase SLT domain-containing protein [Pseudomonadota bacterium]